MPTVVEVIGGARDADAPLGAGYEAVELPSAYVGATFMATLCDLSANGARIAGTIVPPLLSRIALDFEVPSFGPARAVGLIMWRRGVHIHLAGARADTESWIVDPGFGVLFESLDPRARVAIAHLAASPRAVVGA